MFKPEEIKKSLEDLDLNKSDDVMIHGNAGLAVQYAWNNSNDHIENFIQYLIDYFNEGTIIVPTFTYSATKGEVFDPDKTPSHVGLFSEKFRLTKGATRSKNPIFSVACIGTRKKEFVNSINTDCFGIGTLFDKVYYNNVKILALGSPLKNAATFIHYIEQELNIPYRYFKKFKYLLQDNSNLSEGEISYFVRDLNSNYILDLRNFEEIAIKEKKMLRTNFGRFSARTISAKNFYNIAHSMLKKNPYSMVKKS